MLLHVMVGIDDVQKRISIATLGRGKHDDFVQGRNFLQELLQIGSEMAYTVTVSLLYVIWN